MQLIQNNKKELSSSPTLYEFRLKAITDFFLFRQQSDIPRTGCVIDSTLFFQHNYSHAQVNLYSIFKMLNNTYCLTK